MTAASPQRESKHIQRNGYVAEIMTSHSTLMDATIYHYVIQREGWPEVLHWGQEVSLQRAMECVNEFIDRRTSKPA